MTNNLSRTEVAESQNQKEVTINDSDGVLDAAITATLAVPVDTTNAVTLTAAQWTRNVIFKVDEASAGPATGAITVTVPATTRGLFVIINNTAFTVTVTIASQTITAPVVAAGALALLSSDGINVQRPSGSDESYDVGGTHQGVPTADLVIFQFLAPRAFTIPATSGQAKAGTAATAQTNFSLQKNGTTFGTMRFAAAATTATFVNVTATSFAAGDELRIVAPSTPDTTLADLVFSLAGTKG